MSAAEGVVVVVTVVLVLAGAMAALARVAPDSDPRGAGPRAYGAGVGRAVSVGGAGLVLTGLVATVSAQVGAQVGTGIAWLAVSAGLVLALGGAYLAERARLDDPGSRRTTDHM